MKTSDPLFLLALVAILGCQGDRIESARVEKQAPATPPPVQPSTNVAPPAMPPAETQAPPPSRVGQALQWTLPKGWGMEAGGGMRYATLKPAGKAEVSVVRLEGDAGGPLANVNRWRAQLGLPPVAEAAMASSRRTVKSKAGDVAVFEFSNAGNRMVVGLLAAADGSTWFLKLQGEDAPVSQARPDFMQLLGTLRLG